MAVAEQWQRSKALETFLSNEATLGRTSGGGGASIRVVVCIWPGLEWGQTKEIFGHFGWWAAFQLGARYQSTIFPSVNLFLQRYLEYPICRWILFEGDEIIRGGGVSVGFLEGNLEDVFWGLPPGGGYYLWCNVGSNEIPYLLHLRQIVELRMKTQVGATKATPPACLMFSTSDLGHQMRDWVVKAVSPLKHCKIKSGVTKRRGQLADFVHFWAWTKTIWPQFVAFVQALLQVGVSQTYPNMGGNK